MSDDAEADEVGYGRPPQSSRFAKGRSGNPKGRPKGKVSGIPYDAVLGQLVTIKDDGVERQVTADEAFLLYMAKQGLAGRESAARATLATIKSAKLLRSQITKTSGMNFVVQVVSPGNPSNAMVTLGMAKKLDASRQSVCLALEPWIVEAALAWLSDRHLSTDQQKVIVDATRTPHKVKWPDWWQVRD